MRRGDRGVFGFWLEERLEPDWFWTTTFRDLGDRYGRPRPPHCGLALARLTEYFGHLEREARRKIGWVLVLDQGRIGGRIHAHALVAGVMHLDRGEWWNRAYNQFGRARIDLYEEREGGAQYVAKHAMTETGEIYFGGGLLETHSSAQPQPVGRLVVARSADVPSSLFHMTLRKGHRR